MERIAITMHLTCEDAKIVAADQLNTLALIMMTTRGGLTRGTVKSLGGKEVGTYIVDTYPVPTERVTS